MALPAPAHVNQLTAGTKFSKGPYAGQPSGPFDCAVAAGRMALDAYSHGALRPSTTDFRKKQEDQDHNGIGLNDIAAAWKGYGQRFDYGSKPFRLVYERLVAGNGACIPGHYLNLGAWRASTFGDNPKDKGGPHMMWLQRTAPGGILTDDPLRSSAVVIPTAAIERFYGGSAGWGHGLYAGDTTGAPAASVCPTAAQFDAALAAAGVSSADDYRLANGDAAKVIAKLAQQGFTGNLGNGGCGIADGAIVLLIRQALGQPNSFAPGLTTDVNTSIAAAAASIGTAFNDAAVGLVVNVAIAGSIIGLAYIGLKNLLGAGAGEASPVTITNLVPAAAAPAAAAAGVVKQLGLGKGKRPQSRPRPPAGRTRGPVPVFVVPKPEGRK